MRKSQARNIQKRCFFLKYTFYSSKVDVGKNNFSKANLKLEITLKKIFLERIKFSGLQQKRTTLRTNIECKIFPGFQLQDFNFNDAHLLFRKN